jgi:hypothetical protein
MREIVDEKRLANEHWPNPVLEAHRRARLLALVVLDHFTTYTHQLRGPEVPYFSGPVVVRAALDAASSLFWLTAPAIGTEARVQRGQLAMVPASLQMKKAPAELPSVRADGKEALARIKNGASALGWATVTRDDGGARPSMGGEELPRPVEALRALFDDPAKSSSHPDEARLIWWHLSAYTHSTLHALLDHVEIATGPVASLLGFSEQQVFTNGSQVSTMAAILGRGVRAAMHSYRDLLGAELAGWEEIHDRWWNTVVDIYESTPQTD